MNTRRGEGTTQYPDKTDNSSRQKLIAAAVHSLAGEGHAGASLRGIAESSGLPASSIYHHFGTLEHLFLQAHAHALHQAEQWCAEQLNLVSGMPSDCPAMFSSLFAGLIDAWARECRALRLVWHECHLRAGRSPEYVDTNARWHALWRSFWEEMCSRCGLPGSGEISSFVFDGESLLHLMQWRRPVDRACLDEFASGWGNWLTGSLAPEGPWRKYAREAALKARPALPEQDEVAAHIAAAAADIVERDGAGKLTHRAVAKQAGLTLGTVSYNFRTSSDLAHAAFEAIYTRIAASAEETSVHSLSSQLEQVTNLGFASPRILALEELIGAVARDPDLRAFAPQLRYLRGRSSGRALHAALGGKTQVSPLDAALYSSFLGGQGRALRGWEAKDMQAEMASASDRLLSLLRPKAGGPAK